MLSFGDRLDLQTHQWAPFRVFLRRAYLIFYYGTTLIDLIKKQVRCPQGNVSARVVGARRRAGSRPIIVAFDKHACGGCPVRPTVPVPSTPGRRLRLPPRTSTRRWPRRRPGLPAQEALAL